MRHEAQAAYVLAGGVPLGTIQPLVFCSDGVPCVLIVSVTSDEGDVYAGFETGAAGAGKDVCGTGIATETSFCGFDLDEIVHVGVNKPAMLLQVGIASRGQEDTSEGDGREVSLLPIVGTLAFHYEHLAQPIDLVPIAPGPNGRQTRTSVAVPVGMLLQLSVYMLIWEFLS
jgi:hypothetical protein